MSQSEYGQGARRVSEGCGFWVPHGYGGRQAHILGRGLKEKVIVLYQKVAKLGDHAGAVEFENFPFASCLRALKEGDYNEFDGKLKYSKQELRNLFQALSVHMCKELRNLLLAMCSYVSGASQSVSKMSLVACSR